MGTRYRCTEYVSTSENRKPTSLQLLRHRADLRSIAFILLAIACYAVQWLEVFNHPLLVLAGMLLAFIACIVNHNHQHHRTFVPGWMNSCFGVLVSLAAGVPGTVVVAMHNHNHHQHNNDQHDHVRASIVGFRWRWLNLLLFPFIAVAHFAGEKRAVMRQWKQDSPRLYRQLMLERLTLYPLLIVLLVAKPQATLLYLGLPFLFGQWAILAINHVQHVGCIAGSRFNHSRNFVGRFANWWFLNNGFHTAHHQRPGLHWSKLPDYHDSIVQNISPELNCRSLLWSLVELYVLPRRHSVALTDLTHSHEVRS